MFSPPKVLVAAPVNERKKYCLAEYLQNCIELTYPNKEFYFVDNSEDVNFHVDEIIANGWDCDYISPIGKRHQDFITISQNIIRKKAIEENFDYLLFLECDIFAPSNIIEQLISYHAPVVSVQYFIGEVENARLLKMEIEPKTFGRYTNRNIFQDEGFLETKGNGKSRSSMNGFGCCLIHKSVLELFPFTVQPNDVSHSDSHYYFQLHEAGIKTTIHPVIVKHKNQSWIH